MGLAIADWCLVASCPDPYPPTLPNAIPEHNVIEKNVFTNNAFNPQGPFGGLGADITYVVPTPAPGTTDTDNCFSDNQTLTPPPKDIVAIPPITQQNRCN